MINEILATDVKINFAPANVVEEVLQNVRTIISTPKYSVPLDREFGVTATWLDDPIPVAQAKLTAEIIMEIRKREPRAKISEVSFTSDQDGRLVPKVKVIIDESA